MRVKSSRKNIMFNKKTIMFVALAVIIPFATFAAGTTTTTTATTGDADAGLAKLGSWLSTLGQLIIAATVVAFFWGVFQFVFSPEKKEEGKSMMLWGITGLFVMVSLWGIIGFLQKSTVGDNASVRNGLNGLVPTIITN